MQSSIESNNQRSMWVSLVQVSQVLVEPACHRLSSNRMLVHADCDLAYHWLLPGKASQSIPLQEEACVVLATASVQARGQTTGVIWLRYGSMAKSVTCVDVMSITCFLGICDVESCCRHSKLLLVYDPSKVIHFGKATDSG